MKLLLKFASFTIVLTWSATAQDTALKDVFKDHFLVGAALNQAQFSGQAARDTAIVTQQFDSISPENVLKWESIHPEPDKYNFSPADQYVDFGLTHHMFIVGHNLVWHSQTPSWVFKDADGKPLTRDALLARLHDHIATVVGRYKGKINGWDVVNEGLNEDGSLRKTSWEKIIGDDYLLKVFQFAHEADPAVELYYNDYSIENPSKRAGAIALIQKLKSEGAAISGVGLQGHYDLTWPSAALLDDALNDYAKLGIKIMITELDVDVLPRAGRPQSADISNRAEMRAGNNPYTNGLPEDMQQKLAARYAELFSVFVKHREISRVTFWGVTDAHSWLNNFPVRGRTNYPLLFDREGQPKPAFTSVVKAAMP